ncbi:MAG TPA: efflux transporter outer membrane subunit [Steroidobacteraceae bacterium]
MIACRRGSLILVLSLAGCAADAPYRSPTVSVPSTFSVTAERPSSHEAEAEWWKSFNDPALTALVSRALIENTDIQEAASRIKQARLQERIERGTHGPQINASAQGGATRLSKNALPSAFANLFGPNTGESPSGSGLGLPGESFTTYQMGFDASWELDVFGGQRRANDAAHARTEAAIWSARDAEIMLTAEVANTYQQYRALQRRIALADEVLAIQREALDYIRVRTRNGLVPDSDERRQERELAQNIAQREELGSEVDVQAHALAVLLGAPPNAVLAELATVMTEAPAQAEVPAGLPSELLQRRPDLRAADRQIAAATAEIGMAKADLYPKFSLTGAVQLASRSLSSILESDSLQDNFAARVSVPLLNRGRLHANVELRQAQADEAVLQYRKAVLSALRDVEDALRRLDAQRHRLDQFRTAARAAQDEADSATVRYHNGLSAASDVLTARQTWEVALDAQVQAEAAVAQDTVALYKALGGGWDEHRFPIEQDGSNGSGS